MFKVYDKETGNLVATFTISAYEYLKEKHFNKYYFGVYDDAGILQWTLHDEDDLIGFRDAIARSATWKVPIEKEKDHVKPSHYKAYMFDMQWLEAMQYIPRFRDPKVFQGAVELQVRKYLDRCGSKDEEVQELAKAEWYLRFLRAYLKNGGPIKFENIDEILGE